jgi:hypothetical protein
MEDLIWLALALGLTVLGIIYIWLLGDARQEPKP